MGMNMAHHSAGHVSGAYGARRSRCESIPADMTEQPLFTAQDLVQIGQQMRAPCVDCESLCCAGWESVPGGSDLSRLHKLGTLRDPVNEDPTVEEHHPDGTRSWSMDAPIAPAWFPYNRCDVWRCARCGKAFLRYTETGGYYSDERIRELDPALVVNA